MSKALVALVAVVMCCLSTHGASTGNIARGRPTSQSSTYPGGESSKAVDGNKNTDLSNGGNCSHTKNEANAWWSVDLGENNNYYIERVGITNRKSSSSNRLKNFDVTVGNKRQTSKMCFHQQEPLKGGVTTMLECSYPLQGRYLFIIMKGKAPEFLTLCQVEVFAGVTPLSMVNLALGRPTEQASTRYGGVSSRAVDGDLSVEWKKGACTYTKVQQNPWLEVKLDKEYVLGRIRLTNRGDCCGERLSNIEIRIGNVDRNPDVNALCVKRMAAVAQAQSEDFHCTSPIRGKYVYVILRKKGLLTLCELEVFIANIARLEKTKQSSVKFGGVASRIVDGNRNVHYKGGSCMHTQAGPRPWAMVDLGKRYKVNEVIIANRGDCCGGWLRSFDIRVGDTDGQPGKNPLCIHYEAAVPQGGVIDLVCQNERTGRYVFLLLLRQNAVLHICELEVYSY